MPQAEKVLDSRVLKKTRQQVYMEHLVKWMHKPDFEATWVPESDFVKSGIDLFLVSSAVTWLLFWGGSMVQEHLRVEMPLTNFDFWDPHVVM